MSSGNLERIGRNLLKIKLPHLRKRIQQQGGESFTALCKAYAEAARLRDELQSSQSADGALLRKYSKACDDIELDVDQYLLTSHIN